MKFSPKLDLRQEQRISFEHKGFLMDGQYRMNLDRSWLGQFFKVNTYWIQVKEILYGPNEHLTYMQIRCKVYL